MLGPLVYCAAFWPLSEHESICALGFNDSKQLKESDREQYFRTIMAHPSIGWIISETSAEILSQVLACLYIYIFCVLLNAGNVKKSTCIIKFNQL